MKPYLLRSLLALCVFAGANASATVRYVDLNSTSPTPPYTNWFTAATNIQDAVDAAVAGDQILVTNGIYDTGDRGGNRVTVTNAVAVRSVNGPEFTLIRGYQVPGLTNGLGAIRCVSMGAGASLSGFTLTNGATTGGQGGIGGGVSASVNAFLTNCAIVGNACAFEGGGAWGGTLVNCTLRSNVAAGSAFGGYGGGASRSVLVGCSLIGNRAQSTSGGADLCTISNCVVRGNIAGVWGGGMYGGIAYNSVISGNSAPQGGSGVYQVLLFNCIVYYNLPLGGLNSVGSSFSYSCTTPQPGGFGNITNAPLFVDLNGGDFHLQSNSPCINSGWNSYAAGGSDLDGNPRIAGGTVDIGAYEYQSPVSMISYAWLQQYNLIPDAAVDSADSDDDGHGNWQEWIAGTIPTDSTSLLRLLQPTTGAAGVTVIWQSVSNRTYFLEHATTLGAASPFSLLTSNIVGQAGTTTFTDTNAIGDGPFIYRVGVQ